MRGRGKGPSFEREIAKKLSVWWSKLGHDDLLWRTQASGARATTRTKAGKKTRGQYGDICAVDGRARGLLKCFTISLKRGYQSISLQDIADKTEGRKEPEFEGWIKECMEHKRHAGSIAWMLIFKKNRRETLIFMPLSFVLSELSFNRRKEIMEAIPNVFFSIKGKMKKKKIKVIGPDRYLAWWVRNNTTVFGMNFEKFLEIVTRRQIETIVARHKEKK
jgi:hypothetical protein